MTDQVHTFKYPGPGGPSGRQRQPGRESFVLCQTENVISTVQVFEKGLKNTLHSHPEEDGVWMVLGGQATFYGEGDKVIGMLGPHEGVFLPRKTKYWFENSGDGPLEIMRVDYKVRD